MLHRCIGSGECALAQGELACVHGGSLCCSSFGLVVYALCLSMVLSRMCRAFALAKGSETCSSSSDLALCLFFGF
jgi:hypothetical protein